jgi:5-oxoprolinase (ATP-hydrolysing) subunit A
MNRMDVNCDMGEMPGAVFDGAQEAMMPFLTSVNIACGGHAGDLETMRATVEQAQRWGLAVGAHPGYPDRANFGRVALKMTLEAVADFVYEQVRTLADVAVSCGTRLTHVKAHGALYNQAAKDRPLSRAVADGVARWRRDVALVGPAGSAMLDVFGEAGFRAVAEAFADRRYEPDGSLRSRKFDDALIRDPEEAARQALRIAERGTVIACGGTEITVKAETICIHGDTLGAVRIAEMVAETLRRARVELKAVASDE